MPYGLVGKKPEELAGKLFIKDKVTKVQTKVVIVDRNEELDKRGPLKVGVKEK